MEVKFSLNLKLQKIKNTSKGVFYSSGCKRLLFLIIVETKPSHILNRVFFLYGGTSWKPLYPRLVYIGPGGVVCEGIFPPFHSHLLWSGMPDVSAIRIS